jgi:uncharacterized lipoprotein YmbA
MRTPILILAAVLLSACSSEEEPVANRFDRTNAEIENKARAIEAEVASQVNAAEAQMQNEIDALAEQANAANAVDLNSTNSAN